MDQSTIIKYSAAELGRAIGCGRATAEQALEAVLSQIEAKESLLHCYITIEEAAARQRAASVQKKIESGELSGPLAGVPIALKDNICTAGIPTTCGSKMLRHFVPSYNAEVVDRLNKAGAVLIGKTNMDEFAFGSTTETSFFGPTRNPVDPTHVPGGSSGGSAAAVAAGECFAALGSDTGGSVRQPAACCGVVGFKPTYGSVSRFGLVAYASSMDQIGPLCKTVEDAALLYGCIAGRDEKDATSVSGSPDPGSLQERVAGLRIGIPEDLCREASPQVLSVLEDCAARLVSLGASAEHFLLTRTELVVPAYYTIACAEASSNLERYDGIKYGHSAADAEGLHDLYRKTRSEGFGAEAKKRILLGSYCLSAGYYEAYYRKAMFAREQIKASFAQAFEKYDILLTPVMAAAAPKLGESLSDPIGMYRNDVYTAAANLAGLPAISVPFGRDDRGLPLAVQLMAAPFRDDLLLQAAAGVERLGKEAANE